MPMKQLIARSRLSILKKLSTRLKIVIFRPSAMLSGKAKSLSASLQNPAVKVDEISQKAADMAHEVVTHLPAVVDVIVISPDLNQPSV